MTGNNETVKTTRATVMIGAIARRPTIKKENPRLKGVLPIQYAQPALDKQRFETILGG